MIDIIAQIGLVIFSEIAIILVAEKNKWGYVYGLLSQPFWFISSYMNKQWGIFILSIIYTGTWMYGCYTWFFRDSNKKLKK